MNNGLGYKLANVPTITGLSTVTADEIMSSSINANSLIINGVDISNVLTGITYSNVGGIDLTTIDNNLMITSGKKIKNATVPTANDDITNKLYVDSKVSLTGNETISGDKTFNGTMIINSGHNWRFYLPSTGITASITLSFPFYQIYPIVVNTPITITLPTPTSDMLGAHLYFKKLIYNSVITFNVVSGSIIPFNGFTGVGSVILTTSQYQTEFYCNGSIYYQVNTDLPNFVSTDTAQTISAIKTFTAVPLCATAPTTANMLCNKTYVDSVIPVTTNFVTTNTAQNITAIKTFSNTSTVFTDATPTIPNSTTFKQNIVSNKFEMTQNYLSGGYNFISKDATGTDRTTSIFGSAIIAQEYRIYDGINFTSQSYSNPNYTIENAANGDIIFKTSNGITGVTQFIINNTNCSFTQAPVCSVAPTTANMLCNKTYVDTTAGNYVTLTTTQTVSGQKSFTNASNTYAGSGASLTGVVLTTSNQSVAGVKTFTGDIVLSDGGTNNATIDQAINFFNIKNNILNNTITTITGLIPSQNLGCIVRTDSVAVVNGYAAVSGVNITGINGVNNPYFNNFFVTGTNAGTAAITVQAINQIQSTEALTIGTYMTTFIGTRFSLGTYVTADLGLGVYSITPNALGSFFAKATTGVSYTSLNRTFSGPAAVGTITLDYNNVTNIQSLNSSALLLNAMSVKPKSTTSQVDIYGDVKLQGSLQYNYGGTITATTTLQNPLSQLYLITTTSAITITLPTANVALTGTIVIFKRFATSVGVTTINQVGGGANIILYNGLNAVTSVPLAATTYSITFMCVGVNWFNTTITT